MNKNPIDMLFDENNTDPIVLYNADGEETSFEQIAMIPLNGEIYAILRPLDFTDGIEDDEALVFMIAEEDGEQYLEIVDDIDIVDAVFEEYYTMLAEKGII